MSSYEQKIHIKYFSIRCLLWRELVYQTLEFYNEGINYVGSKQERNCYMKSVFYWTGEDFKYNWNSNWKQENRNHYKKILFLLEKLAKENIC